MSEVNLYPRYAESRLREASADSLAWRMEILRVHPLTQGELARRQPRFLDALFAGAFKARPHRTARGPACGAERGGHGGAGR